MEAALTQHYPLTTNFVRTVDRVSHKLLLKFTLGFETRIRRIVHEDDNDEYDELNEGNIHMDDTDGLTDVLNDFEEITKTLNDVDIDLNEQEFDINGSTFIDRAKNFSEDVEELLRGKCINNNLDDISGKGINNDIGDIISQAFNGKDKVAAKKCIENEENTIAVKKAVIEDNSSSYRDAEELLNANLNDNLTSELNFNDVSINTTDLNDTDSNLVETFNNFILDHDYLDENLLETGDSIIKNNIIAKKTEEECLLREIIPNIVKKGKKLLLKENETVSKRVIKPVKNLSKLKEFNKRFEAKSRHSESIKEISLSTHDKTVEEDSEFKFIEPEASDFKVKPELSKEFLKFGEDFQFRVYELTREQQLEELQKKREGVLYLSAEYKCVDCAKGFRSLGTYQNHMNVHSQSYGMFACDICRMRHKSVARKRRHEDAHRLQYRCVRCACVVRTRDKAEAHYLWHAGKTFKCQHCGEVFGKVSTHLSHVRLQHPGACAWCPLCGEGFVGALGLRLHARRKHPVSKPEESVDCYCFTCRIQFRNPDAFRRHKAVSSGCPNDLRPCVECGESFESDEMLSEHQRRSHVQVPVKCHACELSFSSLASCATHHARAHRRVRARAPPARRAETKCVCELCGKKYHSPAALSYHKRSHTGERPFACPLCPKAFAFKHTLQAHIRTHTGERPYRCAQCSRAFPNANNLARHNRQVHLGQKQYSRCPECLKWFSSPSAARLHAAAAH